MATKIKARQDAAFLRSLPFDQQLARISLASINPGPDGVESMSKCKYETAVYEVKEPHLFYDDFKLLEFAVPSSPATTSPLLALPKKVRQRIYAYSLIYPDPIPIRMQTATNAKFGSNSIVRQSWFCSPPLLRACRKLEKDATPLFYANNSFRAELTDGDIGTLLTWLSSIDSKYSALVPELIISLTPSAFFDIDRLRRDDANGETHVITEMLTKLLTNKGISGDRILMVSREMIHLDKDAKLLGRGVRDAEKLRDLWFDELQKWFDYEEYGIRGTDQAEYEVVTGAMEYGGQEALRAE